MSMRDWGGMMVSARIALAEPAAHARLDEFPMAGTPWVRPYVTWRRQATEGDSDERDPDVQEREGHGPTRRVR